MRVYVWKHVREAVSDILASIWRRILAPILVLYLVLLREIIKIYLNDALQSYTCKARICVYSIHTPFGGHLRHTLPRYLSNFYTI